MLPVSLFCFPVVPFAHVIISSLNTDMAAKKYYTAFGSLMNSNDGSAGKISGVGYATVFIYPNKYARIDFSIRIVSYTAGTDNGWGINRDLLAKRNSSIPKITPIAGGVVAYYDSSGALIPGVGKLNGSGGTFSVLSSVPQFWCPARVYDNSGTPAIGAWTLTGVSSALKINSYLVGVCYGTV